MKDGCGFLRRHVNDTRGLISGCCCKKHVIGRECEVKNGILVWLEGEILL